MPLPFYLRPRMLGLHLTTLVAVLVMIWLGLWQFGRWDHAGQRPPGSSASLPPVDLAEVVRVGQDLPDAARGRHVTATGTYLPQGQLLLPGRTREGVEGFWVLTPLQSADGNATAVLRGWVRAAGDAATPPSGTVEIAGQLQQAEPVDTSDDTLPEGQAQAASPVVLASLIDAPLYPGLLVLQSQTPHPSGAAPLPVRVRVEGGGRGGGALRNLAYATQWWIFVGFAVWVWTRLLRDAAHRPVKIEA